MKIIKTIGKIIETKELTSTAMEITFSLEDEMDFLPGAFVNIFFDIDGKKIRRAYSISSNYENKKEIKISVRKQKGGAVSPIFWNKDILNKKVEIIGPLGLNTSDKINKKKVFLFSFGIGISVVKSLIYDLVKRENIEEIFIINGNRNEKEILYQDFFKKVILENNKKIILKNILSRPENSDYKLKGYIQENISDYDFNNADIFICGREKHCDSLILEIKRKNPENINFLVEAFH